ncbi:hypothetical protein [Lentzea guizhouensis]|uniref:hypothetical protein n=1 Tax=Lentzea guizhouensis TaxID=1586287 RepID=UPI0012B69A30|nr:hypothetical protein [Lentzea guizhouensis]
MPLRILGSISLLEVGSDERACPLINNASAGTADRAADHDLTDLVLVALADRGARSSTWSAERRSNDGRADPCQAPADVEKKVDAQLDAIEAARRAWPV